jgi:hypothetical protein
MRGPTGPTRDRVTTISSPALSSRRLVIPLVPQVNLLFTISLIESLRDCVMSFFLPTTNVSIPKKTQLRYGFQIAELFKLESPSAVWLFLGQISREVQSHSYPLPHPGRVPNVGITAILLVCT